jgi:hypothetical protein
VQLRCTISINCTPDISDTHWAVCFTLRWDERGYRVPRGMLPPEDGSPAEKAPHFSELAGCQLARGFERVFLERFQSGLRMRPCRIRHRQAKDTS